MSVEFGLWNFRQNSIDPMQIQRVRKMFSAYACDGESEYTDDEVALLHLPFHVTPESESERQPFLTDSGKSLLWDGRLDNRQELIESLRETLREDLSDAAIAAVAIESWGTCGLKKLVGDWALSLWDPKERVVLLAKDFLGTRSLFYTVEENCFMWSTLIDPLLLAMRRPLQLQEEYLAGWLSHFPATHLTPFAGVHSVPPAAYVVFRPNAVTVHQYWTFDSNNRIRYRDDRDYEDHFRNVFSEAVRRRLRATAPVLAELSGGMDSSSIVCMADHVMAQGSSGTPRLDTISSFDDSEPNWNEAPFFGKVEERRGRAGHHVALDFGKHWHPLFDPNVFAGTPGFGCNLNDNAVYESHIVSGRYRVLLQGTGGDEVLGGVPTPLPELADLFVSARVSFFLRRLLVWAIAQRIPMLQLAGGTIRLFLPTSLSRRSPARPTWLTPQFARRNARALKRLRSALPSVWPGAELRGQPLRSRKSAQTDRGCGHFAPASCRAPLPIFGQRPAGISLRHTTGAARPTEPTQVSHASRTCGHRARRNPQPPAQGVSRPSAVDFPQSRIAAASGACERHEAGSHGHRGRGCISLPSRDSHRGRITSDRTGLANVADRSVACSPCILDL